MGTADGGPHLFPWRLTPGVVLINEELELMDNSAVVAEAKTWPTRPEAGLRNVRLTVVALWATFVATGILVSSLRFTQEHEYSTTLGFVTQQKDVLGLLALVMVTLTFGCTLVRLHIVAARLKFSASLVGAVQSTLAVLTIATVAMHLGALAAGSDFGGSASRLLVPFVWNDRTPDPVAAGVVAGWLLVAFGAGVTLRGHRPGASKRRVLLLGVLIVAVLLTVLHTILLAGWVGGWAM